MGPPFLSTLYIRPDRQRKAIAPLLPRPVELSGRIGKGMETLDEDGAFDTSFFGHGHDPESILLVYWPACLRFGKLRVKKSMKPSALSFPTPSP